MAQIKKQLRRAARPSTVNGVAEWESGVAKWESGYLNVTFRRFGYRTSFPCPAGEAANKAANLGVRLLTDMTVHV